MKGVGRDIIHAGQHLWKDRKECVARVVQSVWRLSYRLERPEFESRVDESFSSPNMSCRLWGPRSLHFNGHPGSFPGKVAGE